MDASLVAGLDAAYDSAETEGADGTSAGRCWAAAVLWDLGAGVVRAQAVVESRVSFPYVPGLLALRELPGLLEALSHLSRTPDVLLCDGHGVAHPLRFGLACHLGKAMDLPTIGCAKSRLIGEYKDPGEASGSRSALIDRGERIGTVLRTRTGTRPIFVSVGCLLELADAERLVMACIRASRVPEPLRLAHLLATRAADCRNQKGNGEKSSL